VTGAARDSNADHESLNEEEEEESDEQTTIDTASIKKNASRSTL